MKTVKKEIITYESVYVAEDGKEFSNETDCKQWEESYKFTITESWKNIKKINVYDTDMGLPWSSEDHECYMLKPENMDDIIIINAYIRATTAAECKLTNKDIGEVLVLNFGYDHDWCDVYDIKKHLKNIKTMVENNIKKLEEGKNENA